MTKYLDYDGVSKLWGKTKTHVAAQIKANVKDKKGVANGIASLDANGRVPLAQLGNLDTQVFIVVEKLPTTGIKTDKIYIVKDSATAGDLYQEYYYTNGAWEKLGTHQLQVDWTTLNNHIANTSNPHKVTKAQVGLGNVDNTSDAAKPVSTAQATAIADAKKAGTDAQSNLTTHANNKSNPHGVTKAQVGLGNVDNTSDAAKPVSTAQKAALDLKADKNDLKGYLPLSGGTLTGDLTVKNTFELVISDDGSDNIIIDLDGLNVGNTIYGVGQIENRNPTGESFTISIPTKNGTFALTDDVKTATANKVDKVAGKGLSTNDYTTAEKNKLAGIPANANHTDVDSALNANSTNPVQNKVVKGALDGKVDNSTYNTKMTSLDQKNNSQDTAIAGKADKSALDSKVNVTDVPDGQLKKIKNYGLSIAVVDVNLMDFSKSTADKVNIRMDTADTHGTGDEEGFDVDFPVASNTAAGTMSAADKSKLDGIPADANHTTVDASLNNTSANPVQNKAVFSALSGKVDNSTYNTDKTSLQGAIDAKLNKTDIVAITDAELDALLV